MKFKVWVLAYGERTYATNGLSFDTIQEAVNYGKDLLSRWFGADKFSVLPDHPQFTGFLTPDIIQEQKVG